MSYLSNDFDKKEIIGSLQKIVKSLKDEASGMIGPDNQNDPIEDKAFHLERQSVYLSALQIEKAITELESLQ